MCDGGECGCLHGIRRGGSQQVGVQGARREMCAGDRPTYQWERLLLGGQQVMRASDRDKGGRNQRAVSSITLMCRCNGESLEEQPGRRA